MTVAWTGLEQFVAQDFFAVGKFANLILCAPAKSKGVYKGSKQRISRFVSLLGVVWAPAAIAREVGATARHARRIMDELGFGLSTNERRKKVSI